MRIVPLVLGGCLLALARSAGAGDRGPTYTNDDLERLAPRRAETGVTSVPAFGFEGEGPTASPHDEAYWRREADRLREQLRPLRQRAVSLQLRIDRPLPRDPKAKGGAPSTARTPHHRSTTGATATTAATTTEADRTAALRAQLQALQEQIREREARLEERARREGALPGWLR
jgi:hypothetical protein